MLQIRKKFSLFAFLVLLGCGEDASTPLPYAYPRVDLPVTSYEWLADSCAYTFQKSIFSKTRKPERRENECWLNLEYPALNATVFLSYQSISSLDELTAYVSEAQRMTFKHTIKASSIEEIPIYKAADAVYGYYYKVGGDAASNAQFFLTDSNQHFLRGAVYFNVAPEADSLAPLIDHLRKDVEKLLESFVWID